MLVAPGDYKESTGRAPSGRPTLPAGVLITTPRIHLRGLARGGTVVDATRPGAPACSRTAADQQFGPSDGKGGRRGLNGVMVYEAGGVSIENLTVCNYMHGTADTGNEVWFNDGSDTGRLGPARGFLGAYLTTTSTYFGSNTTAAQYGLFSSNWSGGTFAQDYASNFKDSGLYIGACRQLCNQVVDHLWSQYDALGYSGSNAGGSLVVQNSEFDHNEDGFDTNSQNGDNPPPQDGSCPNGGVSPITHTHSCWVFMHNFVHDNNNANVPAFGTAAQGPVGTGISLSGARNDTVTGNRFVNNNAWGVILVPYPDSGPPCTGGTRSGTSCLYDEWGDAIINNTFTHNGGYGHPTNGDIAQLNLEGGHPVDCYRGNVDTGGAVTSSPAGLQTSHPRCTGSPDGPNQNPLFLGETLCDSRVELVPGVPAACPTGPYPRNTATPMPPVPAGLRSLADPCAGVPADPWCAGRVQSARGCAAAGVASIPLAVSRGERLLAVSARLGGRSLAGRRRGGALRVVLPGFAGRTVRIAVAERLSVAGHPERVGFTERVRRC